MLCCQLVPCTFWSAPVSVALSCGLLSACCMHSSDLSLLQVRSKSEKLARAEQANAELNSQLTAERRAAKQAGAGAQKQLLGSMRRIQYMVSVVHNAYHERSWLG